LHRYPSERFRASVNRHQNTQKPHINTQHDR
jgi:hypothetical protein